MVGSQREIDPFVIGCVSGAPNDYRRLETLPDTKARLRLNVALPIAFDGFGTLEVDLR
jgi:hypothetical protein